MVDPIQQGLRLLVNVALSYTQAENGKSLFLVPGAYQSGIGGGHSPTRRLQFRQTEDAMSTGVNPGLLLRFHQRDDSFIGKLVTDVETGTLHHNSCQVHTAVFICFSKKGI